MAGKIEIIWMTSAEECTMSRGAIIAIRMNLLPKPRGILVLLWWVHRLVWPLPKVFHVPVPIGHSRATSIKPATLIVFSSCGSIQRHASLFVRRPAFLLALLRAVDDLFTSNALVDAFVRAPINIATQSTRIRSNTGSRFVRHF